MPSPELILDGLSRVSHVWISVAVLWHLVVLVALGALLPEIRVRQRLGATLLTLPLLSVAAAAVYARLWFNAVVFVTLFAALFAFARVMPDDRIHTGTRWITVVGMAGVLYGLFYPHFLPDQPAYVYAVAAPFGLVPCPTLATLMGFTLLADGFSSRVWSLVLGVAGMFYGIVGTAWLDVQLDVVLAGVALFTVLYAIWPMRLKQVDRFHRAAVTRPH